MIELLNNVDRKISENESTKSLKKSVTEVVLEIILCAITAWFVPFLTSMAVTTKLLGSRTISGAEEITVCAFGITVCLTAIGIVIYMVYKKASPKCILLFTAIIGGVFGNITACLL